MIKKTILMIVAVIMVFGLIGCGSLSSFSNANDIGSNGRADANTSNTANSNNSNDSGALNIVNTTTEPDITLDDFSISIAQSVIDGVSCVTSQYTNNSDYIILYAVLGYTAKDGITKEYLLDNYEGYDFGFGEDWTVDDIYLAVMYGEDAVQLANRRGYDSNASPEKQEEINNSITRLYPGETSEKQPVLRNLFDKINYSEFENFQPAMLKICYADVNSTDVLSDFKTMFYDCNTGQYSTEQNKKGV